MGQRAPWADHVTHRAKGTGRVYHPRPAAGDPGTNMATALGARGAPLHIAAALVFVVREKSAGQTSTLSSSALGGGALGCGALRGGARSGGGHNLSCKPTGAGPRLSLVPTPRFHHRRTPAPRLRLRLCLRLVPAPQQPLAPTAAPNPCPRCHSCLCRERKQPRRRVRTLPPSPPHISHTSRAHIAHRLRRLDMAFSAHG